MLLLAVLVGFPAQADDFLLRLANAPAGAPLVTLVGAEQNEPEDPLGRGLRSLFRSGAAWPANASAYQAEIGQVSRFSFRTSVGLRR